MCFCTIVIDHRRHPQIQLSFVEVDFSLFVLELLLQSKEQKSSSTIRFCSPIEKQKMNFTTFRAQIYSLPSNLLRGMNNCVHICGIIKDKLNPFPYFVDCGKAPTETTYLTSAALSKFLFPYKLYLQCYHLF